MSNVTDVRSCTHAHTYDNTANQAQKKYEEMNDFYTHCMHMLSTVKFQQLHLTLITFKQQWQSSFHRQRRNKKKR